MNSLVTEQMRSNRGLDVPRHSDFPVLVSLPAVHTPRSHRKPKDEAHFVRTLCFVVKIHGCQPEFRGDFSAKILSNAPAIMFG